VTPTIRVAVCVEAPARPDRSLEALVGQVERPLVVISGRDVHDSRALESHVRTKVSHAEVVREDAPGLAQARNRALACCDADVVAFLDGDVAVGGGWMTALTAAWTQADDALGCLGGPIRPRFGAGRPGWLGDGLLAGLALLDYGDRALELDARKRTLHAGNASFRATALRGVGGFWPARGHPDGRDWFAEEHHAQRELGSVGWRLGYRPELEAWRVPDPAELRRGRLLRRRWRYGARLARLGTPRPGRVAARAAASGTLGAPLAALAGDAQRAMDRLGRAAENGGVLLAPLIAARDFEPVAAATPFRRSVPLPARQGAAGPGWPHGPARRPRGRAAILLYHRVAVVPADPLGLCVSPSNFAAQLDVLRGECEPLALAELAARAHDGRPLPRVAIAVTFDDGYADNLHEAGPALTRAQLPATLFASTGHIAREDWFWWDELDGLLRDAGEDDRGILEITLDSDIRAWAPGNARERAATRRRLHAWLAPQSPERIAEALAQVRGWLGVPAAEAVDPAYRPLSVEELVALARHVDVGAHTRRHPSLGQAPLVAQEREIAGSRDDLSAWLGRAPASFSYPFGVPGLDFTRETARLVKEAGFRQAVGNHPGTVGPETDRFALPRHVVPDVGAEAFAQWLAERVWRATPARFRTARAGSHADR
jgi:peptidoglycan/xylan/chitin deacetylase (PgdA/CDA1 family)